MKTIFILFCSIISCLGQAFTWHDLALVESQNAGAAFQPSDVSGLVMWFDASTISSPTNSNGYLVTNWWDRSSSAYMLYNNANAQQPYWTNNASRINNKPWLQFDGTDDRLKMATTQLYVQPSTVFIVAYYEYVASGSTRTFFDGTNSSYRNTVAVDGNTRPVLNVILTGNTIVTSNKWYLFEGTITNGGSEILTNGVSNKTGDGGVASLSGLYVGCTVFTSSFHMGGIAEILYYNANVSSGDRTKIRTYFTDKYGPYANW